jgi:hypothetical protein
VQARATNDNAAFLGDKARHKCIQKLKLQKKVQKAEREAAKLRGKKDTGDHKLAVQRREAAMKLENTGMVNDTSSSANPILAKPFDVGT